MARVPSVHWNESVFRFNLVRHLLAQNPGLDCRTEWNRVDLAIQRPEGATLVELKFYAARPHHDHKGELVRFKGGPSPQNQRELFASLDSLRFARRQAWAKQCGQIIDAYLVLVYLDPREPNRRRTFASYYDAIEAPNERVSRVWTVLRATPTADGRLFTCKLLEVPLEPAA